MSGGRDGRLRQQTNPGKRTGPGIEAMPSDTEKIGGTIDIINLTFSQQFPLLGRSDDFSRLYRITSD